MAAGKWETLFIIAVLCNKQMQCLSSSYVAAVYEHHVVLNPKPHVPLSRQEALQHMRQNLQVYEQQAASAAQKGAQIIVFPEDGLHGFNFSRSSIRPYLEVVPDPQLEVWNPCEHPELHPNTEVQQWLSCMARRYDLYLVANMGSLQPCSSGSAPCPEDGRWQFNTNVVFRSDGQLVARYHKHNLYFEEAFDRPPHTELVTFHTPFAGTFGLITCFDILFRQPTVELLQKGVRQLIFPSAWMNQLPLLDTIQFQRALSLGANVTLLGANIRNEQLIMSGSGLFSPSAAVYHHALSGEPEEGRLIVATLSTMEPLTQAHKAEPDEGQADSDSYSGSDSGSDSGSCPADGCAAPHSFISTMMHDPFTFVLLSGRRGQLRVCAGSFCCSLHYQLTLSNHTELYALGAFSGLHTVNGNYSLQVCALVKCAGAEPGSCGQEVVRAETKMDFVLEGRFGTRYVYPSVLSSQYTLEQPGSLHTTPQGSVTMEHSNMEAGLVTAVLYGRMYHLDPN